MPCFLFLLNILQQKILLKKVAFIEGWINNYPKKLFNYKTPFEIFSIG